MNKIEFQDYPSTETPLNAENLNQMQTNIEESINASKSKLVTISNGAITSKGVFDLKDNIWNYDLILVFATNNAYNNRHLCNIFHPTLYMYDNYVQLIQYNQTDWDNSIEIYDNKVDTTKSNFLGTDKYQIYRIMGLKL